VHSFNSAIAPLGAQASKMQHYWPQHAQKCNGAICHDMIRLTHKTNNINNITSIHDNTGKMLSLLHMISDNQKWQQSSNNIRSFQIYTTTLTTL